jgi:hypothetical protein
VNDVLAVFVALVLVGGYVAGLLLYARPRRRQHPVLDRPTPKAPQHADMDRAYNAGHDDVTAGWIAWTKTKTPAELAEQARTYEQWEAAEWQAHIAKVELEKIKLRANGGYSGPSPMGTPDQQLQRILDQHPRPDWGLDALREHMADLDRHAARELNFIRSGQVSDRRARTAAIITDVREDSYDPATAPQTSGWAFHAEAAVRAAYLAGRGAGTENIIDTITRTRAKLREIDQAGLSIEAASARHAAALAALRETNPTTSARDEHAEWEAEQRAIAGEDRPEK